MPKQLHCSVCSKCNKKARFNLGWLWWFRAIIGTTSGLGVKLHKPNTSPIYTTHKHHVVAPRLPEHLVDSDWHKSGYVPEAVWLKLAKEAGFVLEASSDMHINPKDTATHPRGIWTLPPTLSLGEENKEKYLAIGEPTCMTLKFRKPAN